MSLWTWLTSAKSSSSSRSQGSSPISSSRPTLPTTKMSTSEKLYLHASKDFGLKEIPGSASNPRIKSAISTAAGWLDKDDSETAWCGCIMGLWCIEIDVTPPSTYFRAASWLNVGKPVETEKSVRGDIVIFSRSGGNHVTLVDHWDEDFIWCLGGNQSNAVTIAKYSREKIKGIRRLA